MKRLAVAISWLCLAAPAHALDLGWVRTLDGAVTNGQFGIACVVVGDMDGDGFAEYAIGASADSTGGAAAGRVFIYRGGPQHMSDPPAWTLTGQPGDLLGASLAAADVDGDGLADLIIGAPAGTTVNPSLPGRVLIAFGSPLPGTRAPVSVSGALAGSRFGAAVAGLAGYRGAGPADIAVGAPDANGGAGTVTVLHGGMSPAPSFTLHGRMSGDNFGTAVACAGRTRGGAYTDLLVGAPFNSDFRVWAGKVYLYPGGAGVDTVPAASWSGAAAGDFFGTSLAGAGDVNGDGLDDFVIGAPGANVGALVDAGSAYLFLGAATPPASAALSVTGATDDAQLGLAVAGIGDVDGDGFADWAAGAPGAPDTNQTGEARVFLGRAVPVAAPDTIFTGEAPNDMFGGAVSNGGTVDAGHHAFFLIGSYAHGIGGRAYLTGSANATASVGAGAPPGVRITELWPNPASDRVRVAWSGMRPEAVEVALLDLQGRRVRSLRAAAAREQRLDVSGVPPGLYFVRVSGATDAAIRRLVIVR